MGHVGRGGGGDDVHVAIILSVDQRGSSFSKELQIKEEYSVVQQTMELMVVEDESETESEAETETEAEAETETEAEEEEDEEIEEMEVMDDELDLLDIDELNRRFEEFIERERMKRRLEEALQLAML
ncbi:hypothetical protein J5N97_008393 [Dioscorea zingiberensis]|uniref:Uncharacterized protein n=1 Tax=Dioscorea zingiberensis TaxID=325984 RepID=A0A9D5CXE2_9LILI|nr:hypothetical protein J5N97_008393 [Dioscorea zingiberensis]